MKLLFLFGAIPHYLEPVLSRLNKHIEVYVCVPEIKSQTIGQGVKVEKKKFDFNVIYLREFTTYYKKPFLEGIEKVLDDVQPNILVMGWPYILSIVFYPKLFFKLRKLNIKIAFRDIPFQVPKFFEAINPFKSRVMINENGDKIKVNKLSDIFLAFLRLIFANLADLHLYYASVGFEIYKSYFVKSEKMHLLSNSPDTDKLLKVYNELKKSVHPENNTIIHVGRLVKWKKVDLLLKAVKIIKERIPNVKLKVIGDGPEKQNLQKLVDDFELKNNVDFLGAIYEPKVLGKEFLSSEIYVIAGMGGLSINEAMCFAKPIICSVCDGTEKDLVFENFNGLYFQEDNYLDLAEKIIFLLQNKEMLNNFGQNSLKIIEEKININILVENYLKAFHKFNLNKEK
ncbi:MAG TPA: glycosyltransferase [Ignavibacteriales bacterium]|jgi:glycosyltransferase involved in cell wall biosynthesis|nr:glycosyltransferase [Ignavibacteriales bacterium]